MPASRGSSPKKRTQKSVKSAETVDSESDTPLATSAGKTSSSTTKRKGRKAKRDSTPPSSDDAQRSPKKLRVATPLPSSPAGSPPVTISSDEDGALVDETPQKRTRTPSSKARNMAKSLPTIAVKSPAAKPSKSSPAKTLTARSQKQVTLDDIKMSAEQSVIETGLDEPKDDEVIAWDASDDDTLPKSNKGKRRMHSSPDPTPPQSSSTQRRAARDNAIELVPSILQPPTRSQLIYPRIDGFTPPYDSDYDEQTESFDPVDTEVMPIEGQDPKLQRDYTRVPELTFAEMMPFGHQSSLNHSHFTENYSPTWAALRGDEVTRRRFRCAIRFKNHFPYVNPSRAPPSIVTREGDRLLISNPQLRRQTAVFLTVGIVAQCELVTPGWGGTSNSYQVRRIAVCPFSTEYQLAIAFFGNVLGCKMFVGALADGNMIFGTRREATGSGSASPATPSRRGRRPITFKNAASSSAYPGSLGFNEHVPIYDARNDDRFLFTNANMDQLRELPLYTGTNNQPCDLPRDTLAMVGYAINTFTYNGSLHPGAVAVSFNVLFVIALGDVDRPLLEEISEKMA